MQTPALPTGFSRIIPVHGRFFNTLFLYDFAGDVQDVTVHALRKQQRLLPMLRIPNRQNLLPELYRTEFSVQKIPTHEK